MTITKKVQNELDYLDQKDRQEQITMDSQSSGDLKDDQKPASSDSFENTKDSSENGADLGIELENDIQKNYSAIGPLKSEWKNQRGEIIAVNYGTACALTKRLILTCTHNIYSQKREQFCSEVLFFPQVDQQRLDQHKGYRSIKGRFYRCLDPHFSFAQKPIKQQLCLIALQKDLPINLFIQIGNFSNKQKRFHENLSIIGYPNERYWNAFKLENVQVDRHRLVGKIYSFQENIINHTMKTKKGFSGSPILYQSQEGKWMAIAIHTHRGEEGIYNSGLYFTPGIIGLMKKFQKQLKDVYTLNDCIKYKAEDTDIQDLSFLSTGNEHQETDSDFKELSSYMSTDQSNCESQINPFKIEWISLENSKKQEQSQIMYLSENVIFEENWQNFKEKELTIEMEREEQSIFNSSGKQSQAVVTDQSQSDFTEFYLARLQEMHELEIINQLQKQKKINGQYFEQNYVKQQKEQIQFINQGKTNRQEVDNLRPYKKQFLNQRDLKSKQYSISEISGITKHHLLVIKN